MNGHVIYGTPIAVDFFKVASFYDSQFVLFLSHAHADHTVGLTNTWRSGPIYMSAVTADIICHEKKVGRKWLRVLEVGESSLIQCKNSSDSFVVTPIDARHCAGSVMFLFQGKFGNILYTGDFRFCDRLMLCNEALLQCSTIHRLYLDNTYCEHDIEFGSREAVADEIIKMIGEDPNRRVFIGITKLGKEDLLVTVAQHFSVPIVVDEDIYAFLQVLNNMPNVFSTDLRASRIRAVMATKLRRFKGNRYADDLLIIPTAMFSGIAKNGVRYMPYSNHSTLGELKAFVAEIKPRKIIPIVNHDVSLKCRSDMSVFDHLLDKRGHSSESAEHLSLLPNTAPSPVLRSVYLDHGYISRRSSRLSRKRIGIVEPSKGVEFQDSSSESSNESDEDLVHFQRKSDSSSEGSPMNFALHKDILEGHDVSSCVCISFEDSSRSGNTAAETGIDIDKGATFGPKDCKLLQDPQTIDLEEITEIVCASAEVTAEPDATVTEDGGTTSVIVEDAGNAEAKMNFSTAPRHRSRKEVLEEWDRLAKLFRQKRLANEIPLYYEKYTE